jgi:hypothetical protein
VSAENVALVREVMAHVPGLETEFAPEEALRAAGVAE